MIVWCWCHTVVLSLGPCASPRTVGPWAYLALRGPALVPSGCLARGSGGAPAPRRLLLSFRLGACRRGAGPRAVLTWSGPGWALVLALCLSVVAARSLAEWCCL